MNIEKHVFQTREMSITKTELMLYLSLAEENLLYDEAEILRCQREGEEKELLQARLYHKFDSYVMYLLKGIEEAIRGEEKCQ